MIGVPQKNEALANKLNVYAYIISAVVLMLVSMMRRVKIHTDVDFSFLPPVHAILNTLVAIFLIVALYYIKNKNVKMHQRMMNAAMLGSILFLSCYVLYHFTTEETKYCGEGTLRLVYFVLLLTHILLAAISLPLILLTYIKGYTGQVEAHKKMTRWVYPIWLYVAVTGPICYLMLAPCYK
jgi:putative membrane protein